MLEPHEKYVGLLAALLLIAGGAFWAGMAYQASQVPPQASAVTNSQQPPVQPLPEEANAAPTGGVFGKVISVSASGATIQSADGQNRMISFSASTTIQLTKVTNISPSAIATGDIISAFGLVDSDGTIKALSVQVSPTQ